MSNKGLSSFYREDHEELWQPAWGVRTGKPFCLSLTMSMNNPVPAAILGLQGFFPLKGQAAVGVGSIEAPLMERKRLAVLCVVLYFLLPSSAHPIPFARSREWVCPHCQQSNLHLLPDPTDIAAEMRHVNLASTSGPQPPLLPSDSALSPESTAIHIPLSTESYSSPSTTDLVASQSGTHNVDTTIPARAPVTSNMIHSTRQKPLLVLDTVICVLLAMAVAIICRRII